MMAKGASCGMDSWSFDGDRPGEYDAAAMDGVDSGGGIGGGGMAADVAVVAPKDSPMVAFGVERLAGALKEAGQAVTLVDPPGENLSEGVQVVVRIDPYLTGADNRPLAAESYRISRSSKPKLTRIELAGDGCGGGGVCGDGSGRAGALRDGADGDCGQDGLAAARVSRDQVQPAVGSAYRTSPVLEQHRETCKDLIFWEAYLDMMAGNRFNVLSFLVQCIPTPT